jgi:SMC interacting uncharacterized protein involved in chromosome segregation
MNRRLRRLRHHQRRDRRANRGMVSLPSPDHDWQGFDAALTQLETSVEMLRQRFERVRELQAQQAQVEEQLKVSGLSAEDLSQLQERLQDLELQLESHLFDWRSLREPFWQAVRFGGLGIILGWILHAIASR